MGPCLCGDTACPVCGTAQGTLEPPDGSEPIPFPDKRYQVILADPPWAYRAFSEAQHGAASSAYQTQDQEWIEALPVGDLADPKGCALLMWATWPKLQEAIDTIKAWGFQYVTCAFVWCKEWPSGMPYCGLGHYTRSGTEFCLLAKRGKVTVEARDVYQVIHAEVREHSAKPPEVIHRIERLWPDASRIELFCRRRWPGWDGWGNQVEDAMPLYPDGEEH
jgi:site-specific DNA-methyltransferase (adenine-specific)